MKKTLLFLFLMMFMTGVFAQSFLFFDHEGTQMEDDAVVEILAEPSAGEIPFELNVQNVTEDSLHIYCKKSYIHIVEGTGNLFCWGGCYLEGTFVSENPVTLHAGEVSADGMFSGHYFPKGQKGTSVIRYTFFDGANPNDSASIRVKYTAGFEGIGENDLYQVSDIYPNPVTDFGRIDFDLNHASMASLVVYDLTGSKVRESILENKKGTVTLPVNDLLSGV